MLRLCAILFIVCAALVVRAVAGPLTPPAGAVASTPGPEPRIAINAINTPGDVSSVYVISNPGSYYLPGNLQGVGQKHGIKITASNVTVDLKGFVVQGGAGLTTGIMALGVGLSDISVENGTVKGWVGSGVDLASASVVRSSVRNVRSVSNQGAGIRMFDHGTAVGCTATSNGLFGFDIFANCVLTDCGATQNGSSGFDTGPYCTISRCTADSNTGRGIGASNGCLIESCNVSHNTIGGIFSAAGCTIRGCVATENTAFGIQPQGQSQVLHNTCTGSITGLDGPASGIRVASSDNRIEGNVCVGNPIGVDVRNTGNLIIKNSCSGNSTNWVFVAGNSYGPIVATAAGAAVNGNSAASSLNSTDANANFSY